ncbi:UBC-like protein [Setomelanomma holmii]|uniref:UBC-like protein n=1 Tax=Setomelanomma holmii TaxID=210430 RepID=A0A9P4LL71_9PLEO|nr:UBC-like protein [Setomelanomma holmii]
MAGNSRNVSPTKRLMTELQTYQNDPNDALLELGPADDDVMHWRAVMKGVVGTAYEGGRWLLDIHIPTAYPLSPPSIRFVTPICHPNVDFKTGEICLDLLKTSWSPAYTVSTTMTSIHQLLTSAEPDSPLNIDIAQLFRIGDEVGAQSLIRFYTETERYEGRREESERYQGRGR